MNERVYRLGRIMGIEVGALDSDIGEEDLLWVPYFYLAVYLELGGVGCGDETALDFLVSSFQLNPVKSYFLNVLGYQREKRAGFMKNFEVLHQKKLKFALAWLKFKKNVVGDGMVNIMWFNYKTQRFVPSAKLACCDRKRIEAAGSYEICRKGTGDY